MDPSLARKAEELSTYIDRVEEQIKKLKNEGATKMSFIEQRRIDERANSALAVTDLMGPPLNQYEPPLTERQQVISSPKHAPLYEEKETALQSLATPNDRRTGSSFKGPVVDNFLKDS